MTTATRTALITGTRRGIGAALKKVFLNRGWNVIACERKQSTPPTPAQATEPSCIHLEMDITNQDSIDKAAQLCASGNLSIDVLINNAGIFPEPSDTPFADLKLEWFQQAMQVNFLGTIRVTQAMLPRLQNSSNPGIVNISSGAASITERSGRRYCYGASKAALNHLTRGLANELKPQGITVVALSPGWVKTDMGGMEADLEPDSVAESMENTIGALHIGQTGSFLDRFGNPGTYAW